MTMGVRGYAHKKDLKAAVGQPLRVVETSMFGLEYDPDGDNVVVGPDAYNRRDWFAVVTCENGIITKVR
jgi:hypothetical protein